MMTQAEQDTINNIQDENDIEKVVKGIYSLSSYEDSLYERPKTMTIVGENFYISEDDIDIDVEEDENPILTAEKKFQTSQKRFNKQQLYAYLMKLLQLLENSESTKSKLKKWKTYTDYQTNEGQEKQNAFEKVSKYLIMAVEAYFAYLSDYSTNQNGSSFLSFFKEHGAIGEEKEEGKVQTVPSSFFEIIEDNQNEKGSGYVDQDEIDEHTQQRLEEEEKKRKSTLQGKMSHDMREALEVYVDLFGELEPLNVESNLLKELAEKKGESATIDRLKALSRSSELTGIAKFLKLAMATTKPIKNQYKKS